MEENIYEFEATEVILRITQEDARIFDKSNVYSIIQIKEKLKEKEVECYFQKINEEEHKLTLEFMEGQLEFFVKQDRSETYEVIINNKLKTKFIETTQLPLQDFIKETISLNLIDVNDKGRATDEFIFLYEKIQQLDYATNINIDNHQQIWVQWINAQEAIINHLQTPYEVKNKFKIIENGSDSSIRYSVNFELEGDILPEYNQLEVELQKLEIDSKFDIQGNIALTRNEILVLDNIIERNFKETFERSAIISTILTIRPFTVAQFIEEKINKQVIKNKKDNSLSIFGSSNKFIDEEFEKNGYKFRSSSGKFTITNQVEIMDNSDIVTNKGYSFHDFESSDRVIGLPQKNIFYKNNSDIVNISIYYNKLSEIFGSENIKINIISTYEAIDSETSAIKESFSDDFWIRLKRKLYVYNLEDSINPYNQSLYLEWTNRDELINQLDILDKINTSSEKEERFNIVYSPLEEDFQFKIKTNVITKKTQKEIFLEKLKTLGGTDFVVELSNSNPNNKRVSLEYVGKLNNRDSDIQNLVLKLDNFYPSDKRDTKKALEFLKSDEAKSIKQIRANLRGDAAKIEWLKTALQKVTAPEPNSKAQNDRLGEFIFDTSKATPIYDESKLEKDSSYYNEIKNNELLQLNEVQRKAVLAAISCKDLALLQGPPGTGKTTVIAEIIWQMISKNPEHKILLTSETNLAVDNALDRLLNTRGINEKLKNSTTLIKPLRFGRLKKIDEEGAKYSIDRINEWASGTQENISYDEATSIEESDENDDEVEIGNIDNNAVSHWMRKIASRAKVNDPKYEEALKDWSLDLSYPTKEVKELFKNKYFEYVNVIGSTCSSCGGRAFESSFQVVYNTKKNYIEKPTNKRTWIPVSFDTVIMDEASKATPPELLLPLCFAERSIIIGDHKQLPPMLHEKDFKEALKDIGANELADQIDNEFTETSQFERMILNPKISPTLISRCNIQYRMHPDINNAIRQFYLDDGGLEPASELIENANDTNLNNIFSRHHGLYAENFVDQNTHVIWVDVKGFETREGTSLTNEAEAETIRKVIYKLKEAEGFEAFQNHWNNIKDDFKRRQEQEIGVISFYGAQKRLIKQKLAGINGVYTKINTVDRFQGMERNIVIVSTVRSDKQIGFGNKVFNNTDSGFAKSPKRLNVALSRAKRLLIVVGNKDFFAQVKDKHGTELYRNVIQEIHESGKVIDSNSI